MAKVNTLIVAVDPQSGDRVVLREGDTVPAGIAVDDALLAPEPKRPTSKQATSKSAE